MADLDPEAVLGLLARSPGRPVVNLASQTLFLDSHSEGGPASTNLSSRRLFISLETSICGLGDMAWEEAGDGGGGSMRRVIDVSKDEVLLMLRLADSQSIENGEMRVCDSTSMFWVLVQY